MDEPRTVTVAGEGTVTARPDLATFTVGVSSTSARLARAWEDTTAGVARILDALRGAGIGDEQLQTANVTVYTRRDGESNVLRYDVSNRVSATVRDLPRLGEILGSVVAAGANDVQGPSFDVADPEPLRQRARGAAMADARQRAGEYARHAGGALAAVLSVSEFLGDGPGGSPRAQGAMLFDRSAAALPAPVESGEITVTARVRVTYALTDPRPEAGTPG